MEEDRDFIEFQGIKFFWHPKYKYYLASKSGQILSLKRNKKRILKFQNNGNNYLIFCLCEKNKKRFYYIHRFVFETFKGEIPEGMHIDHFDFDRKNNIIDNLQILTPKENTRKSKCKKVKSYNIKTFEEKIFDSLTEAAKYHQITIGTVGYNCKKISTITKSKKDGKRYKFFYL